MKTYFVYILECKDGLLYTGFTNNLSRRLEEHQLGKNKTSFTFKRRPVTLIWHQMFNNVEQAILVEKQIKKWSSKKKWALAKGEEKMLKILAECRNASHYKYKPD